jgi:hypothetical protein
MGPTRATATLAFLSLVLPVVLSAQASASQDEEKPAAPLVAREATPQRYQDAEAGFALRLAGGFGFLARQESLVLFGSKITPGLVLLETGETFTEQELAEATRVGYQDEGVSLTPEGPAIRLNLARGVGVAFPVKGTLDNQAVRGFLAGVRSNTGRCFILLTVTTPESWPELAPTAEQIIGGIELLQPQAPAVDPRLFPYFAGRRLSFLFSRGSFSSTGTREGSFSGTERIYLCSDGSFFYGEQTTASFDVPQAMGYSRTADNSAGRWQVAPAADGATLTLNFHDGRQWRYQATRLGEGVLYLNGSKYFRSGQNRCR